MASCSYIPINNNGEELRGFQDYRKALGYTTARDVFLQVLSPDFQSDYKRYLKFDAQQVPTYESVITVPYIRNFIGAEKLASSIQKNYPWIDNTRNDYERLVEQAHTFNISSAENDTLTAVVEQSENGKKIRVHVVSKNDDNDKVAYNQYGTLGLNRSLSEIFSDIGVTVGTLEEYEADRASGKVDFSKASKMADGFEGLIRIANNAEGVQALPEEFSHLIIGVFRNEPLVARSIALIESDDSLAKEILGDEYQNVYDSYEGAENRDELVAEEALGRVLQDHLKQASERKEEDNSSTLNKLVSRLVRWIKNVFKNYDVNDIVKARQAVDENMQRLGTEFLNGKKKITKEDIANSKRNAVFNHLVDDVDKVLQLVQNARETERKRLRIMPSGATEEKNRVSQRISTLNGLVNDTGKLEGLITYAKWALDDLKESNRLLDDMLSDTEITRFKELRNVQTTIESYSEFISDFRKTLNQYQDAQTVSLGGEEINLLDLWTRIDEQFQAAKTRYEDAVLPAFISFVSPFYDASPVKDKDGNVVPLKRLLSTATKEDIDRGLILNEDVDTTFFDKWTIAMGNSASVIAQLYAKAVNNAKESVRLDTMNKIREVWVLREKAEKRGITSFDWMFEKNRDGKKTGYYISEYNYGQFEEDYQALLDKLDKKYGKNPFGEDYTNYNAERRAWLEENAVSILGKPTPNDKYLNKDYKKLTQAQKETLDEFLDYKLMLETGLPHNKVSKLKAIQRRRSGAQRKLDALTDPASVFLSIKENVKQAFTRNEEDDDQIYGSVAAGLTDFTGKEYMTLPLLYTNKLKNPEELSTDVYSDLMAYAYTTGTYKELDKIIDPLELGKQAIKQKKLLKTRGNKIMEEEIYVDGRKTKRPVYVEEGNNNLLWKIQEYLESQVYGRYIKPQGNLGPVDVQKTVSVMQRLSSTAYLAFNWLAGTANVATAVGMQNIEAAACRFFSPKNLLAADKEYFKLLPEFTTEIGSRNKQSKLALFGELFNIKQDYGEKIKRTQKKNLLQRVFGVNVTYLHQNAGDHWIYNRTGIAMAKHEKVKYKGKSIPLWDALEVVEDKATGKKIMRVKNGVKNLDGTDFSVADFTRKITHINHTVAGIYNDEDQNAANRVIVGRLFQQMRKWIIPQMMRRFESKRTLLDIGGEEEGYYRTALKYMSHFIPGLASELRKAGYQIPAGWSKMTDEEKANVRMAATEIGQFVALWVIMLATFGTGGTKDPDRSWAAKFAEYMLHREIHELGFLTLSPTMVTEGIKTIQSPFVMASAVGDLAKIINVASVPSNWIEEVQSGEYEGYNRVAAAVLKSPIPPITYWKQFHKMFDTIEQNTKFYSKDYR